MIVRKFCRLRVGALVQAPELIDLRDVVAEVIDQRRTWLKRQSIKARTGLLSTRVNADRAALFSLIDELVNWAGNIASKIGFGMGAQAERLVLSDALYACMTFHAPPPAERSGSARQSGLH